MSHDPTITQPFPRTLLADEAAAHRAQVVPFTAAPVAGRRSRLPIALGTTAVVLLSMLVGALVVSRTTAPAAAQSASAKSSTSVAKSASSLPKVVSDAGTSSAPGDAVAAAHQSTDGPTEAVAADQGPGASSSSSAKDVSHHNSAPAPTTAPAPESTDAPSTTAAPKGVGDNKKIVPVPALVPGSQPSTTAPPLPTTTAPTPPKDAPIIKYFMYTRDANCHNLLDEDWVPVNYEVLNADSVVITTGEGYDHMDQPAKAVQTFRVKCDGTPTSITITAKSSSGSASKTVTVPLHRVAP